MIAFLVCNNELLYCPSLLPCVHLILSLLMWNLSLLLECQQLSTKTTDRQTERALDQDLESLALIFLAV